MGTRAAWAGGGSQLIAGVWNWMSFEVHSNPTILWFCVRTQCTDLSAWLWFSPEWEESQWCLRRVKIYGQNRGIALASKTVNNTVVLAIAGCLLIRQQRYRIWIFSQGQSNSSLLKFLWSLWLFCLWTNMHSLCPSTLTVPSPKWKIPREVLQAKTKFAVIDICFLVQIVERSRTTQLVGAQNKAYHLTNKYICFLGEMLSEDCATAL